MSLTLKGKENVYEQIVNEYRRYIELNVIRFNEKLPSCRMLAKELGVNPNTVVKAYNVLENAGYIKVIPKKGVYVIYNTEDKKRSFLEDCIYNLKERNINYDELIAVINKIYGR